MCIVRRGYRDGARSLEVILRSLVEQVMERCRKMAQGWSWKLSAHVLSVVVERHQLSEGKSPPHKKTIVLRILQTSEPWGPDMRCLPTLAEPSDVRCNYQQAVWLPGSADTVCPWLPPILTFDRLTLKLVCESYLRWGTFLANLGMIGLCILELFAMYVTDGQTDGRTKTMLIAPSLRSEA